MEKVVIGKILKPQGIRGEIKVLPSIDDAYLDIKAVYLEGRDGALTVEKCSLRGGFAFLHLEGVSDRNAAEALRGKRLSIDRVNLNLEEGEYLVSDLLKCYIYDDKGDKLGRLTAVDNYGAADVYTAEDGKKVFRFPMIPALNRVVDFENRRITVDGKTLAEVTVYED